VNLSEIAQPRLRVMEMFAGVGGFRLGLEGLGTEEHPRNGAFQVVYSNQWEPSTSKQHASDVYVARWGSAGHCCKDIFDVLNDESEFSSVVDAHPEMLVGGFPCQDYSVAQTAAKGIEGKKGVLWWAIHRTLQRLATAGQPAKYLLFENVDRLLKSPTKCRGRDFAIILSSLASLGYAVEWRVVNAADYGWPTRRKRVFIFGCHRSTPLWQQMSTLETSGHLGSWLSRQGVLASGLPVRPVSDEDVRTLLVGADVLNTQATYAPDRKSMSRFGNTGLMVDGHVSTCDTEPAAICDFRPFVGRREAMTLADALTSGDVPASFHLSEQSLAQWRYLKGSKTEERVTADGYRYNYSEGPMPFPDELTRPSRTVITSEGGSAPSRFKHVVRTSDGRLRRLTAEELEALMGFPRGFTAHASVSDAKRAFLMGNALVVGVVRAIGSALAARLATDSACSGVVGLKALGNDTSETRQTSP